MQAPSPGTRRLLRTLKVFCGIVVWSSSEPKVQTLTEYPKLRPDLIYSTYQGDEGEDSVIINDPVAAKYFRLSCYEFDFLKAFDGRVSFEAALENLKKEGRYYDPDDAKQIFAKAAQAGLFLGTAFGRGEVQARLKERTIELERLKRLFNIYFLLIPLFNPDRFLSKTLPLFRLIWNRWTGLAVLLAVPGAVGLLVDGWPRMRSEYWFFFNVSNMLYLWFTIALTKIIHELSHAYVAKGFGLHVPSLGIGFILFFPVLYCDTTDAWKLADRNKRMAISGAGIMSELAMAVIGAYVWYFSGPGVVNSVAFYLTTYSVVSTVLFNGNPLMKFDGYFLLMDFLRKPNLAQKALLFVKYLWMNRVLGIAAWDNPSVDFRESVVFLYGVAAFVYRLFLVTGIVMGVYYRFDKTLGILLAMLAATLMIFRPMAKGSATLFNQRGSIRPRLMGCLVFGMLLVIGCYLLTVPWSSKSVYPCFMASSKSQKLTIPLLTTVEQLLVSEGSPAKKGEPLMNLDKTELQLNLLEKEIERDILKGEIDMLYLDEGERHRAPGKDIELRQKVAEIDKIKHDLEIATQGVQAPFDGVVTRLDRRVQEGFQPGGGVVVGEFQSQQDGVVHVLIPEQDMEIVRAGQTGTVWFPIGTGVTFPAQLQEIKAYSERDLADSPFSSRVGGEVATEEMAGDKMTADKKRDAPLYAHYIASYHFDNSAARIPLGLTGRFAVPAPPKSLLSRFHDQVYRTFNSETLF